MLARPFKTFLSFGVGYVDASFWEAQFELQFVLIEGICSDIGVNVDLDIFQHHSAGLIEIAPLGAAVDVVVVPGELLDPLIIELDLLQPEHVFDELVHVFGIDEVLDAVGEDHDAHLALDVELLVVFSVEEGLEGDDGHDRHDDGFILDPDFAFLPVVLGI